MSIPGLAVGRIVIFVDMFGKELVAIVSKVVDARAGVVHLHAFVDDIARPVRRFCDVRFDASETPGPDSWHWLPHV